MDLFIILNCFSPCTKFFSQVKVKGKSAFAELLRSICQGVCLLISTVDFVFLGGINQLLVDGFNMTIKKEHLFFTMQTNYQRFFFARNTYTCNRKYKWKFLRGILIKIEIKYTKWFHFSNFFLTKRKYGGQTIILSFLHVTLWTILQYEMFE